MRVCTSAFCLLLQHIFLLLQSSAFCPSLPSTPFCLLPSALACSPLRPSATRFSTSSSPFDLLPPASAYLPPLSTFRPFPSASAWLPLPSTFCYFRQVSALYPGPQQKIEDLPASISFTGANIAKIEKTNNPFSFNPTHFSILTTR